mmetsp:Transcript_26409/g.54771  ORF Transcript_26409/g.54771 Transcript_26409/m.54771 type:complete len:264 (-) Transcript_26409:112-903(-)
MWFGQLFLDSLIVCSDLSLLGTFLALFLKLQTSRSSAGLSLQTLISVVSARSLHLVSHLVRLHYQPTVVPWILFPVVDIVNASLGIVCVVIFTMFYYRSYEKEKDNFGIQAIERLGLLSQNVPLLQRNAIAMGLLYTGIAVVALMWYFVRRSHHSFALSYFCCYYEVLCAIALLPQLWMFHQDRRVQPLLANFVVLTAVSRVCTLLFWIFYPWVYHWSYPDNRGIQMASETLNILILSDFLYYWLRAKLRGQSEVTLGDNMLV